MKKQVKKYTQTVHGNGTYLVPRNYELVAKLLDDLKHKQEPHMHEPKPSGRYQEIQDQQARTMRELKR